MTRTRALLDTGSVALAPVLTACSNGPSDTGPDTAQPPPGRFGHEQNPPTT